MGMTIDSHDFTASIKETLIRIYIKANVCLIEKDDATFEFCVDYKYTGTFGGHGHVCVPVNGNETEEREEGNRFYIGYTISTWDVTESAVSCVLSVYVRYRHIGPEYIFRDQRFAGTRAALIRDQR